MSGLGQLPGGHVHVQNVTMWQNAQKSWLGVNRGVNTEFILNKSLADHLPMSMRDAQCHWHRVAKRFQTHHIAP